ncbi:MAG: NTPase [Chloroflexota bacterium]
MPQVYLLTGLPGTGKTTLVKRAVAGFPGGAGGFYTEEIRRGGERLGFQLVTLDGQEGVLAHVDFARRYRVGKYGVAVDVLEEVGVSALKRAIARCSVIVIDEIGKMELFSELFREAVLAAVESGRKVLGTVMLRSHPWADGLKKLPGVNLFEVTRDNRDRLLVEIQDWLRDIAPGSRAETER